MRLALRTIYKAFNFYIPFLQLIKMSRSFSKYKNLGIYQKLVNIVYSAELIQSMIKAVTETQNDERADLDQESVIYLPDEQEILDIIKAVVN